MLLDSLHIPLYSPMWLYSCIDNKRYIDPHTDDPWNQLLFQPAKGPCIPEMRHFVVSITGFSAKTKPTRDQIKCAIDILGCCYMGPLSKNHTTHLICNNSNRYFASLFVDVALVRKQKMQAVGLLPYTSWSLNGSLIALRSGSIFQRKSIDWLFPLLLLAIRFLRVWQKILLPNALNPPLVNVFCSAVSEILFSSSRYSATTSKACL